MNEKKTFGGLTTFFTAIGAIGAGYFAGRFHMLSQVKKVAPSAVEDNNLTLLGVTSKAKKTGADASNA